MPSVAVVIMTQSSGAVEMTCILYVDTFPHSEGEGWMEAITQQWTLTQDTTVRFPFPAASVTFPDRLTQDTTVRFLFPTASVTFSNGCQDGETIVP